MGQHVASLLLLTTTLGGCSRLYDPDRLSHAADAPEVIDIKCSEMKVTSVAPSIFFEGTGAGGSRPALLLIIGENLVSQSLNVSVAVAGSTRELKKELDYAKVEVGEHGQQLAVPIAWPVDPALAGNEQLALDVTVSQGCQDGPV